MLDMLGFAGSVLLPSLAPAAVAASAAGGAAAEGTLAKVGSVLLVLLLGASLLLLLLLLLLSWLGSVWNMVRRASEPPVAAQSSMHDKDVGMVSVIDASVMTALCLLWWLRRTIFAGPANQWCAAATSNSACKHVALPQ
jgi:hypothetical protein